jgi:hypothetical protein
LTRSPNGEISSENEMQGLLASDPANGTNGEACAPARRRRSVTPKSGSLNSTSCSQRERHNFELPERTRGLELAIAKLESTVEVRKSMIAAASLYMDQQKSWSATTKLLCSPRSCC